jgi:hypothetical protein
VKHESPLSRRTFLKMGGTAIAAAALPWFGKPRKEQPFPDAERLCRVAVDLLEVYSRPHPDSDFMGYVHFDDVLAVNCRVVGEGLKPNNHVWFETPEGYIYSSYAQPVQNKPNVLLEEIPEEGIWMEVSVPLVDGRQAADPAARVTYRLYYSMVLNVDRREIGADGEVWYRGYDENHVVMYAPGESFRKIEPEEIAPISPDVEDKIIRVNLHRQELSAYEQGVEVFYCRISSGFYNREKARWNTPVGESWIWRKMISRHMSAGDQYSGYDLPGVGWTVIFSSDGAAIHSTYWHNDFGTPKSHGCINVTPDDALWLFRWTQPVVDYKPGDLTMHWPDHGNKVIVQAR